jgi:hypothetical protein
MAQVVESYGGSAVRLSLASNRPRHRGNRCHAKWLLARRSPQLYADPATIDLHGEQGLSVQGHTD